MQALDAVEVRQKEDECAEPPVEKGGDKTCSMSVKEKSLDLIG